MNYDVLVVGRPTCDLVFTGLPEWPSPGKEIYVQGMVLTAGGSFNVAAALSRLGFRVGMIGVVGNDHWSQLCLSIMESEGVSTELTRILDRPLPLVSVCMNFAGDRGFLSCEANDPDYQAEVKSHTVEAIGRLGAQVLLTGLGPDLPTYAEVARKRGMKLFVDCFWDESWLRSRQIRDLLPLADVVVANEAEARAITGAGDVLAALRRLGEFASCVVVKRGPDGSSALVRGQEYHVPTEPVTVVDATGAGDCFNAGFLYGLQHGLSVEHSLRLGNICGGMNVAVPGGFAGAPREAELLDRARTYGIVPSKREG